MSENESIARFLSTLRKRPNAIARLAGSSEHPDLFGRVSFYQTNSGVLVSAEVYGLPHTAGNCADGIFAFHIHSGSQCSGNQEDPFANALSHYNPGGCPHPNHAGDLPPLFANHGYAFQVFLTNRFTVREVIDRTVIIHSNPDDFTSQPSGNAGMKIACGQITALPSY